MKLNSRTITALLVLLAAPAAVTMAAQEGSGQAEQEILVSRVYRVSHMDPGDALMLAHQVCLDIRGDHNSCRHEVERRGWFTYNTDANTQEAIAAAGPRVASRGARWRSRQSSFRSTRRQPTSPARSGKRQR